MRNWAPGDSQVYRVKIVRRRQIRNPKYRQPEVMQNDEGRWMKIDATPDEPRHIWVDDDPWTEYIGPYQQIGQAKAQLTRVTKSTWAQEAIVTADIEKGSIIWEVLDE